MSRRRPAEASLAGLGIACILGALAAGRGWWARHFLPIFAIEPSTLVAAEQAVRGLITVVGAALLLVLRRPIAAILNRATIGGALRIPLSAVGGVGGGGRDTRAPPPHPPDAPP